jgi:hypothetical protein
VNRLLRSFREPGHLNPYSADGAGGVGQTDTDTEWREEGGGYEEDGAGRGGKYLDAGSILGSTWEHPAKVEREMLRASEACAAEYDAGVASLVYLADVRRITLQGVGGEWVVIQGPDPWAPRELAPNYTTLVHKRKGTVIQLPHESTGTFCASSPLYRNNSALLIDRWADVEEGAQDAFFAPALVWEARRLAHLTAAAECVSGVGLGLGEGGGRREWGERVGEWKFPHTFGDCFWNKERRRLFGEAEGGGGGAGVGGGGMGEAGNVGVGGGEEGGNWAGGAEGVQAGEGGGSGDSAYACGRWQLRVEETRGLGGGGLGCEGGGCDSLETSSDEDTIPCDVSGGGVDGTGEGEGEGLETQGGGTREVSGVEGDIYSKGGRGGAGVWRAEEAGVAGGAGWGIGGGVPSAHVTSADMREWEAREWEPFERTEEVDEEKERAWREWEGRMAEEASNPLVKYGWKAYLKQVQHPHRKRCSEVILENDSLSFDFWPTCVLTLPGEGEGRGDVGGSFEFVSQEGDAVIFNASATPPRLSCHPRFDKMRARRAEKTGLLKRLRFPRQGPSFEDLQAPLLKRGLFDPAHSDSFSDLVSELNANLDSECLSGVSDDAAENQVTNELVDQLLAHHRAAGGSPPESIDPDEFL